ncbi:MAG: hypothetical protein JSW20_13265 [Nitrospiraceae bacterium]|nr:MAG: hypothetical protein JSW20_13265 [Nitrospiraceae bacterium]
MGKSESRYINLRIDKEDPRPENIKMELTDEYGEAVYREESYAKRGFGPSRYITIEIDKRNPEPDNIKINFADDKGNPLPSNIHNVREPLEIGKKVKYMDRIIYYVLDNNGCVWIDRRLH